MITCPRCGEELSSEGETCRRCAASAGSRADALTGRTIADKYRIESHLGTGGMCDVYRARHTSMGKQFAVKVLKTELAADPRIAERFEQEARAASLIHHPHAISVVDYGHVGPNLHFIVMELVEGKTLGDLIRQQGPLPVRRAAGILRQVANALDAAHSKGVVHRDIKPDNIIIAEYDGSDWVKVVDFGVAKIQEDVNRRARLTGANIIVGTPRYMSPEQCEERPVDARSDIYSLGVVLYEMLSGEAPFEGNSSMRLLMAHVSEQPPPLCQKRPDLSPEIERAVMRALEKDPSLRPQTASELARGFEVAAGLSDDDAGTSDRGESISRISVPIGKPVGDEYLYDDEQTLVRPRQRTPAATRGLYAPGDPDVNPEADTLDEAVEGAPSTPVETYKPGTRPASVVYREYPGARRGGGGWGWALGIIALLLVAAATAYVLFGDRLTGRGNTGGAVLEAQQAVTDALARIDSLPKDHPLRTYLPQLAQWQGELRAYSEVGEYGPEVISRADYYRQRAEEIAGQARLAQAGRSSPPANNSNAGAQQRENRQSLPGEEDDPMLDDDSERGEREQNGNSNTGRQRRAEPPILDPVKPVPPPQPPANSNRPRPDPLP